MESDAAGLKHCFDLAAMKVGRLPLPSRLNAGQFRRLRQDRGRSLGRDRQEFGRHAGMTRRMQQPTLLARGAMDALISNSQMPPFSTAVDSSCRARTRIWPGAAKDCRPIRLRQSIVFAELQSRFVWRTSRSHCDPGHEPTGSRRELRRRAQSSFAAIDSIKDTS